MDMPSTLHVELPATGWLETAKFYAEIFGWVYRGGYPELTVVQKSGEALVYVDSNDLESDLKQIEARGGTVISHDTEIPGLGHMALFCDPAGNQMALWKANSRH